MGNNLASGVLAGRKMAGKHTSVTEAGSFVITKAKELSCVTRIIPAKLAGVGPGIRWLKFVPIPGGIKAKARAGGSMQEIVIMTTEPETVQAKLTSAWEEKYGK